MLKPLTKEELKKYDFLNVTAPDSAVSDKYVFVSTNKVIQYMNKLGWVPVKVTGRKKKKGKTEKHVRHYVRFRERNGNMSKLSGDILYPEIVFENSHDRSCAASFHIGYYRQVCSNGLVVAEEVTLSKKHIGVTFEELQSYVEHLIKKFKKENKTIQKYQTIEMTQKDKVWMAKEVLKTRYPDSAPAIKVKDLLVPKQEEDKKDNLWNVFNVLQQNILEGGYSYTLENGKKRSMKKVTSPKIDFVLNVKLWEVLLKTYAKLTTF